MVLVVVIAGSNAMRFELLQPGYGPDYHLYHFIKTHLGDMVIMFQ